MEASTAAPKLQNDIHGLDHIGSSSKEDSVERSYSVRDLIKVLVDSEDLDALVCIKFRNCDPIAVSDIEFEEGQVVLDGSI